MKNTFMKFLCICILLLTAAGLFSAVKKKDNKNTGTGKENENYNKGVEMYNSDNFISAVEYFTKAIEENKKDYESYMYRAKSNYRAENFDKAHEDIDVVIKAKYKLEWAYFLKGDFYRFNDQDEKSLEFYDKGIAADKNFSRNYTGKAEALYNLEKYREAIDTLNYAPVKFDHGQDYRLRSKCYFFLDEYKAAINESTQYIDMYPNDMTGYYERAICYRGIEDYEKALTDLEKCLTLSPDSHSAYGSMGLIYDDLKKYDMALEYFDKAIKIKNDRYVYYHWKGITLYNINRFSEAENNFNKCLELKKSYNSALLYKAFIADSRRDYNKAIDLYKTVLVNDGENISAMDQLSKIYIELRNFEEAKKILERLYSTDKNSRAYNHNTALMDILKKDYNKAKEQYLLLLAADNKSIYPYLYLAGIARRMKDFKASDEYYKKALEIDNKYYSLYLGRSIYNYELNGIDKALIDIRETINIEKYYIYYYLVNIFYSTQSAVNDVKTALSLLNENKNSWVEIEWHRNLSDYLLTEMGDEKLFTLAGNGSVSLCEAYFYAGTKSLINKDESKAYEYFKKCTQTDAVDIIEYQLAEIYLEKNKK